MTPLSDVEIEARREHSRAGAIAALADSDAVWVWWHLSFSDPDQPVGSQFLGCAWVDAPISDDELVAAGLPVMRAHDLGVNPGGAVQIAGPLTIDELAPHVPETHRLRLLGTREELETVGVDVDEWMARSGARPTDERGE